MGELWQKIRRADNGVLWICEKFAQIVLVSVLWLLACLPVITILPATAALYYACVKSIRREWDSPWKAFLKSFRENCGQGVCLSLAVLLPVGACLYAIVGGASGFAGALARVLLVWVLVWSAWLAMGLSRFSRSFASQLKFAWSAMVASVPRSGGVLLVSLGVICAEILYWPLVLMLPGLWALVTSVLAEPVLVRYMPDDNRPDWYWGAKS